MVRRSDNPIDRSPAEWLCYLNGRIPSVETSLISPNSNFGQWATSWVKFPSLVSKVRAFYEPLGFDVWVESDRRGNIKTLMCKPCNLESVIAYAEVIEPGAKQTIGHYTSDIPSLRKFLKKSLKHSSAELIYDIDAQRFSSYPRFDTFREHTIADLDLSEYRINKDCFFIAICVLLDECSGCEDKVNINYHVSFNGKEEYVVELYFEKIKKSSDRHNLPPL